MAYRPRFGSRKREALFAECVLQAHLAGRGTSPICPHCDQPVAPGEPWDECHVGRPKAFGGKLTRVGHRRCNRDDGAKVVVPALAKSNAVRKRHLGITGPGLGRHPMRAGRRSGESKTMRHGVQPRRTLAQKHALTMAKRAILTQQPEG